MSLLELVIKSSVQVVVVKRSDPTIRVAFGSGVVVEHERRLFLVTAGHVTNHDDTVASIQLYGTNRGLESPVWRTGQLNYVESVRVHPVSLEVESVAEVDVAYCELPTNISVLHPEVIADDITIAPGPACFLPLSECIPPVKEKEHLFYGRVNYNDNGVRITFSGCLRSELTYQRTTPENYHLFTAPSSLRFDYSGCSGAPVLDEDGRFAGIVVSVAPGTPMVFVLPSQQIHTFVDLYARNNPPVTANVP